MPPLHDKVTGVVSARSLPAARSSVQELEAILDHLPSIVTLWGADMRNIYANRAGQDFFGRTAAEINGIHIHDLIGPELFEQNLPLIQGALGGEPQDFVRVLTDHNGNRRDSQISYTPLIMDGIVRGFFVTVIDISARAAAEAALRENAAHIATLQERQRVYGGLHGNVIERLFAVERSLHEALVSAPGERPATVADAIVGIDDAIRQLRESIGELNRGIRPQVLDTAR